MTAANSQAWLQAALGLPVGSSPFPWQRRLVRDLCAGRRPTVLDLPTGLGKTSVIAIWLVARALGAAVPRRLVYVVDRRAVVDQATTEATKLQELVARTPELQRALGLAGRLRICTLRGQLSARSEWVLG